MKGYCDKCGVVIDETEQVNGLCHDCWIENTSLEWSVKHDGVITRGSKK